MNQPSSACSASLNDISRPTTSLPHSSQAVQLPNPPNHIIHDTHQASPEAASGMQMDVPVDDMPNDAQDSDLQHTSTTPPEHVKYFPGASQSYPGGRTFMDQFFSDKHSELRKENLYYLFVSQEDWQLVSWLLCSRLSMAAIDSFLSLDLVSYM